MSDQKRPFENRRCGREARYLSFSVLTWVKSRCELTGFGKNRLANNEETEWRTNEGYLYSTPTRSRLTVQSRADSADGFEMKRTGISQPRPRTRPHFCTQMLCSPRIAQTTLDPTRVGHKQSGTNRNPEQTHATKVKSKNKIIRRHDRQQQPCAFTLSRSVSSSSPSSLPVPATAPARSRSHRPVIARTISSGVSQNARVTPALLTGATTRIRTRTRTRTRTRHDRSRCASRVGRARTSASTLACTA